MNCDMNVETLAFNQDALVLQLKKKGADLIRFIDISNLTQKITRGLSKAILICTLLSKEYVVNMRKGIQTLDKFSETEHKTDELAEWTEIYIHKIGYKAFAQSEENNWANGFFDSESKSSTLPHKTIATLAGLGWIGKNNLLITEDYGCALCMCSVLTNAPIKVDMTPIVVSQCGECDICKQICPTKAISGNKWSQDGKRDLLIDVTRCEACLKCLIYCKWTNKYIEQDEAPHFL